MVDVCTSSFRALIVAYGCVLPREAETVFELTGLSGKSGVKRCEQSRGHDTALYKNLPLLLLVVTSQGYILCIYSHLLTVVTLF